jgi:hypothetical protein
MIYVVTVFKEGSFFDFAGCTIRGVTGRGCGAFSGDNFSILGCSIGIEVDIYRILNCWNLVILKDPTQLP